MAERQLGKLEVEGSIPSLGSSIRIRLKFGIILRKEANMAKKGEHRVTLGLVCSVCKNRNYVTTRNKLNTEEKLLLKKYCKHCRKVTEHKENEKLK